MTVSRHFPHLRSRVPPLVPLGLLPALAPGLQHVLLLHLVESGHGQLQHLGHSHVGQGGGQAEAVLAGGCRNSLGCRRAASGRGVGDIGWSDGGGGGGRGGDCACWGGRRRGGCSGGVELLLCGSRWIGRRSGGVEVLAGARQLPELLELLTVAREALHLPELLELLTAAREALHLPELPQLPGPGWKGHSCQGQGLLPRGDGDGEVLEDVVGAEDAGGLGGGQAGPGQEPEEGEDLGGLRRGNRLQ